MMEDTAVSTGRQAELKSLVDEYVKVSDAVMNGFIRCGEILTEISTKKLYEAASCKTMGAFLKQQWGMERRRANQLMAAADAYSKLSKAPGLPMPQNEWQMRELLKVPANKRDTVWAEVVNNAPDAPGGTKKLTQSAVSKAVKSHLKAPAKKKKPVKGAVDELGRPVPDHLVETQASVASLRRVVFNIGSLMSEVRDLAGKPGGECVDLSEFERAMKQAKEEITHGMYHTECPKAVGKDSCVPACGLCNGCGWIVRGTYNRLSDEDRECLN
jgi:hypothetical protein